MSKGTPQEPGLCLRQDGLLSQRRGFLLALGPRGLTLQLLKPGAQGLVTGSGLGLLLPGPGREGSSDLSHGPQATGYRPPTAR